MSHNNRNIQERQRYGAMNVHFQSAYSKDTVPLPSTCIELNLAVEQIYAIAYNDRYAHLWENSSAEFSIDEVADQIRALSASTDPGPMEIEPHLLKLGIDKLAMPRTNIYNCLLRNGTFPDKWKESYLIPIPKQEKPQNAANYR